MAEGHIFQINASEGGVPKLPVVRAAVTTGGLTADQQADLKHHGGSDRALCLYSLERIIELQAEGHPIFPGASGENLTLWGLDWDRVGPGSILRLGNEVVVEVVSYTVPCGTIGAFFMERQVGRIRQEKHPGWSRVYARVLQGGEISVGDGVEMG